MTPNTNSFIAPAPSSHETNNMVTMDNYDDEPPLLEELGVNISHIKQKTLAVLHPFKKREEEDATLMDDTDMAGPLLFALLLGFSLLLSGKIHFGYIYGFAVFGCFSMSILVNLLSPIPIDTWRTFSILGYCLLPVNLLSAIGIILSLKGYFGFILSAVTIAWCTISSTRLFERSCQMREQRWLVAYPAALVYCCFVLLTVY